MSIAYLLRDYKNVDHLEQKPNLIRKPNKKPIQPTIQPKKLKEPSNDELKDEISLLRSEIKEIKNLFINRTKVPEPIELTLPLPQREDVLKKIALLRTAIWKLERNGDKKGKLKGKREELELQIKLRDEIDKKNNRPIRARSVMPNKNNEVKRIYSVAPERGKDTIRNKKRESKIIIPDELYLCNKT